MPDCRWMVALVCAGALCGQGSGKALTLEDCLRLANAAPSAVTVARQEARIAALGVRAARASFLPHANLAGGAIYNSPRPDRQAFIAFNGAREYTTMASAALELDTSGRLRAAYARAKVDREVAEAGTRISARDLRRAVTIAYYRLLVARRLVDAATASVKEARSFEARVKAMVGGGEAAQADFIKASAQAATLEQGKQAAELDARLANQELASYWTAEVDTPLELEDGLAAAAAGPPAEGAADGAAGVYLRRAEFRVLDLQRQGFALDAKRERAALLPQIFLGYQYGVDAAQYRWDERGQAVTATLNVPIFDWFRARSAAQQFTARVQQVETTRRVNERVYSREYEAAKARMASVYEQLRVAGEQVKLFEENLKLSRVRYEGGEGPALDVVVAQSQLQQARANYYGTLFLYTNARADLEVAAGQ